MTRARAAEIAVGLAAGLVCHAAFAAAIAAMAVGLYTGMQSGVGRLHGTAAVAANTVLLLQFPVLHSLMLGRRGRALLAAVAPRGLGRRLATTSYAAFASAQLLAVFCLWSPSGHVLLRPTGGCLALSQTAFAGSWLLLASAIRDAGTGLQTGFVGWWSVMRGSEPRFGTFPQTGLFRLCRQPVYLAFMLLLWTAPVWTPDRVALALSWSAYCAVGPRFKERRYLAFFGEAYRSYRARVPYMIPGAKP